MQSDAQRQLYSPYNALKIGRRCPLLTITVGVRLADRFATGLVLATICPPVLAAPVAFLGGMSRAAHRKIIVEDGRTCETLARVPSAEFDKTGTLTDGTPTITRMLIREPCEEAGLTARQPLAERAVCCTRYHRPHPHTRKGVHL